MWRAALCSALLSLLVVVAFAAPQFPILTGRVVDEAKVLSPSARQTLEQVLADHEQKTRNQVVMATVKSLGGQPIEEYGVALGRHWGIGQKGKDNGVLLIVAPNERQVRIEVGYGLEGTLTDALASQIIQTVIIPEFKVGRMEQGVINGAQSIVKVLGGESVPQLQSAHTGDPKVVLIIFVGIVLFVGFIIILAAISKRFRTFIIGEDRNNGGGFSGGGGFGGGGGFSGGGGGFGGGGASGRW